MFGVGVGDSVWITPSGPWVCSGEMHGFAHGLDPAVAGAGEVLDLGIGDVDPDAPPARAPDCRP